MQRAALLPSSPHCFASSAVSLRLVSWNVHLHHLSLSGRHAMCCLIDVWIRSLRRGRLSHGSVRQNMCEQKWGHLGRIRNCEDEEGGGIKIKLYESNSAPLHVCVCLTEHQWLLMCALCLYSWVYFCMQRWRPDGEGFFLLLLVPHLMFPSQDKHPSRKMTGTQVWFDRAHLQVLHAVRNQGVH